MDEDHLDELVTVRRTAGGTGAGTFGAIVAILLFGLIGLGLRAVPTVVSGDDLLALAAPRNAVPSAAEGGPVTPAAAPPAAEPEDRPSARPSATPRPKAKPKKIVVPATGPGRYRHAQEAVRAPSGGGRLIRYDVRVEQNLDVDPAEAATIIAGVLNDERSWRGRDRTRFELVPANSERAELHAYIVTPGTTDELCAPLLTQGEVSCQNGNKVVLNAKRWQLGVKAYGRDLVGYRQYLVNHEFGHYIGYGHVECPGRGKPAPVMMQQTKGLDGCRKNPWVESD